MHTESLLDSSLKSLRKRMLGLGVVIVVTLQLFIAVQACAIPTPWAVSMGMEIERCAESSDDPTTLLNCFIEVMADLPDDIRGSFQELAINASMNRPDSMIFAVEMLESKSEITLERMYPGSDWCCILVASMQPNEQTAIFHLECKNTARELENVPRRARSDVTVQVGTTPTDSVPTIPSETDQTSSPLSTLPPVLSICSYGHCVEEFMATCSDDSSFLEDLGDCLLFPFRACAEIICAILDFVTELFDTIVDSFQDLFDFAVDIGQVLANLDIDRRQMEANRLGTLARPIAENVDKLIARIQSDLPRGQRTELTRLLRSAQTNFNRMIDDAQEMIVNQRVDNLQVTIRNATDRLQREIRMALDRLPGKGNATQTALQENGMDTCAVKVNETGGVRITCEVPEECGGTVTRTVPVDFGTTDPTETETATSPTPSPSPFPTSPPDVTALSVCSYRHCVEEFMATCSDDSSFLEDLGDCLLFPFRACAEIICAILDFVTELFDTIVDSFQDLFDFAVDIGQVLANLDIDRRQMEANRLGTLARPIAENVDKLIARIQSDLPRGQRTELTRLLRSAQTNFNRMIDDAQERIVNQRVDNLQMTIRNATDRLQREIRMALDRLPGKGNATQTALEENGMDTCVVKVNETIGVSFTCNVPEQCGGTVRGIVPIEFGVITIPADEDPTSFTESIETSTEVFPTLFPTFLFQRQECDLSLCIQRTEGIVCNNASLAEAALMDCIADTHRMCICDNRKQLNDITEIFENILNEVIVLSSTGILDDQQRNNMAVDVLKRFIEQFPDCDPPKSLLRLELTRRIYNKLVDRALLLAVEEEARDAVEAVVHTANECLGSALMMVLDELNQKLKDVGIGEGIQDGGVGGNCMFEVTDTSYSATCSFSQANCEANIQFEDSGLINSVVTCPAEQK